MKFLDVGCKIGGSFGIAKKFGFSSDDGFGIDINEKHIKNFIESGNRGMVADATQMPFGDGEFDLVICSHVLEHMPDRKSFDKALSEIIRVSKRWVFIAFPIFDHDEYLNSLGLKTYYSDWKGHTCKVHLSELESILSNYKFTVEKIKKLESSEDSEIHPLNSPIDQHHYDFSIHPYKERIVFDREIYREFKLVIEK